MGKRRRGAVGRMLAIGGVGLGLLLLGAAPVRADLAKWDQARVTSIAQQLAKACNAFQDALENQPGEQVGSGEAYQTLDLNRQAEILREKSEALAGNLAKGAGHDKTVDIYRALKETVDDTDQAGERIADVESTEAAWSTVTDLLRQIAPYYDPNADKP